MQHGEVVFEDDVEVIWRALVQEGEPAGGAEGYMRTIGHEYDVEVT